MPWSVPRAILFFCHSPSLRGAERCSPVGDTKAEEEKEKIMVLQPSSRSLQISIPLPYYGQSFLKRTAARGARRPLHGAMPAPTEIDPKERLLHGPTASAVPLGHRRASHFCCTLYESAE